jgi:hypothetical protein
MTPGTLVQFAAAADIGSPVDIDALSIHDHGFDGSYDGPSEDYIIYSTVSGVDVRHYGYGATAGGGTAHDHADFGLLTADEVVALEHKTIPCCALPAEEGPGADVVTQSGDCGGAGESSQDEGGSSGCSVGIVGGARSGRAGVYLLFSLCLLGLIVCRRRLV